MARRIIDMHEHLYENDAADALAEQYARLGVVKAALQGLPPKRMEGNNEAVLEAHRRYPDLFIPFVGFEYDKMGPDDLTRFHDEGFVGVKFIGPHRPYNDASYFPVYERASELGMPVLFHLGIVANNPGWADCDSNLMRPIHLDHIARSFPQLRIVGAHLGNPWYDEATMSCRWNPNLWFDLSGSTLKKKTPQFIGSLLWWTPTTAYKSPERGFAWEKIVFGSDVEWHAVSDVMHDYELLMSALNLSPEIQDAIWYGTAAKVLGLDG